MLFAELEVAANAAVLNQLTNVMVVIGSVTVPGMFRKPSVVANLGQGAADTQPTVTVDSGSVMDHPYGKTIVVAGTPYIIQEASPDGTGLTKLVLADAE